MYRNNGDLTWSCKSLALRFPDSKTASIGTKAPFRPPEIPLERLRDCCLHQVDTPPSELQWRSKLSLVDPFGLLKRQHYKRQIPRPRTRLVAQGPLAEKAGQSDWLQWRYLGAPMAGAQVPLWRFPLAAPVVIPCPPVCEKSSQGASPVKSA